MLWIFKTPVIIKIFKKIINNKGLLVGGLHLKPSIFGNLTMI